MKNRARKLLIIDPIFSVLRQELRIHFRNCYIYFVIPIQVVISFGKMQVNVFIRELTSDALNFVVNTVLTQ